MSHSRKDKVGGHWTRDIEFGGGCVTWSESGRRYAKRWRSKMCRRHSRMSIRDLDVIEPEEVEPDFLDFEDDIWYDYDRDSYHESDDLLWLEESYGRYSDYLYYEEDCYDYDSVDAGASSSHTFRLALDNIPFHEILTYVKERS